MRRRAHNRGLSRASAAAFLDDYQLGVVDAAMVGGAVTEPDEE